MPKVLPNSISAKNKKELLNSFYDFASSLNRQELEEFFHDFLTESEKIIFGRRLKIAKMLLQGLKLREIRQKIGVGTSTVQFVKNWMKDELAERKARRELPMK